MASFRIHEEKENLGFLRLYERKRPQPITRATKVVEQTQKRSVLGVLNKNPSRPQSQKTSKQDVFARTKTQTATFSILEDSEVDENKPLQVQKTTYDLRNAKPITRATKVVEQTQKRSVLGVLNKNPSRPQSQKTSKQDVFARTKTQTATFSILEDSEVDENKPLQVQKTTYDLRNAKPITRATKVVEQTQKRSVLGVLNKNPSRPQSQKTSKQDVFARTKTQTATFAILEDSEVDENKPLQVQKTTYDLRNAKPQSKKLPLASKPVASLPSVVTNGHRPPLQELPVLAQEEDGGGSPMVLESSVETIIVRAEVLHIQPTLDHLLECEEYKDEIYAHLLEAETRNCPKPYYMRKQPDISYSMRSIVVDWLVEVAEEYNLQTETLYLAVGYIDRFLSFVSVVRNNLQLVGTAAMFIASKYEEIYPPHVGDFVYITADHYSKKQVLRMEHLILKVLSFDILRPTTLCFIVNFCSASKIGEKIKFLAMYISELSLLYADPFLQYAPSLTAAACIALARELAQVAPTWPAEMQTITGYSHDRLRPCVGELTRIHAAAADYPQQAVREKYRSSRRHDVASIVRPPAEQ